MGRFSRSRQKQKRKAARRKKQERTPRGGGQNGRHAEMIAEARRLAMESERQCMQALPEVVAFMARQDEEYGLVRHLFTADQWAALSEETDSLYVAAIACGFLQHCLQSDSIDPNREDMSLLAQELMDRLEMWTMIVPLEKDPGDDSWEGLQIAGGCKLGPFLAFHSVCGEPLDLKRPHFQSVCAVSHSESGLRLIELVDLTALSKEAVTAVFSGYHSLLNPAISLPRSNIGAALQRYTPEALELVIEAMLNNQGIPFREECLDLRHRFSCAQLEAAYKARHGTAAVEDLKAAADATQRQSILSRLGNLEEPVISRAGPLNGDFHVADWLWWRGFKEDGSPDTTTDVPS